MSVWKDVTSYSKNDERIPSAWSANLGILTISLTKKHIRNPGYWTLHASLIGIDTYDLKLPDTVDFDTAQSAAKNIVAHKLREMAKEVSKL